MIDGIRSALGSFFDLHISIGEFVFAFFITYSRTILNWLHILFENIFEIALFLTAVLAFGYLLMSIIVSFRKKPKELPKLKKYPQITVQIPTYNELAALNCAQRCVESDYPQDKLQIIIGDDSNKKDISKRIDAYAKKHANVLVTRRGGNAGYKPGNLNHMLKYTKGEFIVIFDSDFLPEKDFIRRIIGPFMKDKNISVVQSRWRINNFGQNIVSVLGGTISLICHYVSLTFINFFGGNGFLCGSGEAIRKSDLIAVGGWQTGSLTEDIECSMRLFQEGKKLVYLETLECDCEAPHTFKDLCKQQMRWAFGVIKALKYHVLGVLSSSKVRTKDKASVLIFTSGYMFSFLLLSITIFGALSLISAEPAPIDWPRFMSETTRNILLTSGFIVTSVVALILNKRIKELPRMIASSLSIGLVVTYYVNVGILKAMFDRDMQWFMLNKNGNKIK